MARWLARYLEWAGLSAAAILGGIIVVAFLAAGGPHFAAHEQTHLDARGRLLLGQGSIDEGGMTITGLDQRGRAMVIFRPSGPVEASSNPFVRLSVDRVPSRFHLSFFWRRSDEPRDPDKAPFGQPSGSLTAYLGDHPGWEGKIIEYGVLLESAGPFPPRDTEIRRIDVSTPVFVSGGIGHRMAAVLDGLLQPWYWSGSASNTIARPNPGQRYGIIPLAFSALCGLTFFLLYCIRQLAVRRTPPVFEAMLGGVALSVFVLAALHTKQLVDQAQSHIGMYSGLADGQAQDAGQDWPIEKEAQEIEQLLEASGMGEYATEKIAIVTPGNQYRHERLFYHLLPNNTYPLEDIGIACKANAVSFLVIDQSGSTTSGMPGGDSIPGCTDRAQEAAASHGKWTVYRLGE